MSEQKIKYTSPPSFIVVVKTNFKKFFVLTMIILVVAVVIVFLKPHTYTSSATLLFPSVGGKLSLLGSGGGDLPSLPMLEGAMLVPQPGSSNSTAITLIKSVRAQKSIISKMMARGYDLKKIWKCKTTAGLYDKMDALLKMSVGKNNELFLDASSKAYSNIKGSDDNNLAFNYMQSVMESLNEITSDLPLDPAKQSENYLKDQIAKTTVELETAANQLKDYQKKNLLIDPDGQAKALAAEYASIQSSVIETKIQADLAMKQLHSVSAKTEQLVRASIDPAFNADGTSNNGGNSGLNALYLSITSTESDLALLKLKLRDAHPDVVNKKAELDELKNRLQTEIKRQLGLANEGLSPAIFGTAMQALIAQAKLDGYRSTEVELKKQIEKMPGIGLNYLKLQAIVTEKTDIMTMLKTEYEKSRIVTETRGPAYVVLDDPEPTNEPDSRGGAKICAIAFFLAMMICMFLSYIEWTKYQPVENDAPKENNNEV